MHIDVVNGTVTLADMRFGAALSRPAFLKSALGVDAEVGVVNEGWVTLHFGPEPGIRASASFKDDRLVQLFVSMALPAGDDKPWDRDFEMRRKSFHDEWLKERLGDPPYHYAWGTVASEFTEQDAASDIVITFGKFPVGESWWDRKSLAREAETRKKS